MRLGAFVVSLAFVGLCPGCTKYAEIAPADESGLSHETRILYTELANAVAMYMSADSDDVEFPSYLARSLRNALIHVHNFDADREWRLGRDLFLAACSYVDLADDTRSMGIVVSASAAWASAWDNGERFTGNQAVDDLLRAYDLNVEPEGYLAGYYRVVSPEPLNQYALARRWMEIPGVDSTRPLPGWDLYEWGNSFFIGSMASLYPSPGYGWYFRYSVGWGDCPSGCTSGHRFGFKVSPDGAVRLLVNEGNPMSEYGSW